MREEEILQRPSAANWNWRGKPGHGQIPGEAVATADDWRAQ